MIIGADRTAVPPIIDRQAVENESVAPQEGRNAVIEPIRFHNPMLSIDPSGVVVVQVRDSQTGEVKVQIPSEKALKAYRNQNLGVPPSSPEVEAVGTVAAAAVSATFPVRTAEKVEGDGSGKAADPQARYQPFPLMA